eukprot:CAMPEP_0198233122 /NCGR_PEP_ID=MMETSP1445-20131203/116078_1 /TAXON_ID=36898 /ORGANISM="Pyramimonas sp., Strain CCMP2087" /LENGTH=321 /DNA_ID=CAMNT_0043913811 /DNA_START=103 /DNA_END=1068 /DNA_ORIENTATION=-
MASLSGVAALSQLKMGSSQRRSGVAAHCTLRFKKAEHAHCLVACPSSTSQRIQLSGSSYLSGTSIRLHVRRASAKRAGVNIRAGWNDFAWSEVKISEKSNNAGMSNLTIDVGEEIVKGYTKPGQFVQVRLSETGKAAFLAIASAPGATKSTLELLVKPVDGATAGDLCALEKGASVEVSPVMGKGFDLSSVPDAKTILIFATGSGISPIKALVEASAANGGLADSAADVRLYFGAQTEGTMAFTDKFDAWKASGVTVVPVLSQGDNKKYVQDVFIEEQGGPIVSAPAETAVVLCGQKEMAEAVKAMCAEAGIPDANILTNF